jgi:phosphoglucomutase
MAQIDPTDHLQRLLPRLQMPLDEHPQIQTAPADLIHQYRQYLCDLYPIQGSENELTVVYTPVHGVGGASARAVFAAVGVNNLIVVPEQFEPHPDFITTPSPNPENPEVLSAAAGLALRHKADLVLATDPDADRAAVMLPDGKGGYRQLTGNEVGALLTAIMIRRYQAAPQENPASPPPVLVKTVVTDRFGAAVAAAAGCEVIEELTGFKNICGVIPDLLRDGKTFLLGYEESIGYAFGDRVRDKDGLAALRILIGEAARLRKEGRTLRDELHQLFEQHGYFISRPFSLSYPGTEGADIIRDIIAAFRTHFPRQAGRARLIRYRDYAKRLEYTPAKDKNGSWTAEPFPEAYLGGKTDNLLSFDFDNGSHYALRPSGTEPKLKFYIYATAPDLETAKDRCEILYTTVSMLADHTAGLV